MSTHFYRRRAGLWIALVALAVFSFPFMMAAQHQPPPPVTESTVDQPNARIEGELPATEEIQGGRQKPSAADEPAKIPCGTTLAEEATGSTETEVVYKLDELMKSPDSYLGKTVTVDGQMHRQFTDKVFTIENHNWPKDHDILVISVSPMSESVIPLEGSFDRKTQVRVTGVLRPYDRGKLECLFGPLNLESREGHSFTKNPVLIIGYKPPAQATAVNMPPPAIEFEILAPPPEPAAAPPAPPPAPEPAPPAPEPAKELPRTAGDLPFVALAGVLSLVAAGSVRFFRSGAVRRK